MDSISEIISTFSPDDVKSFRSFINRQKKLHSRKDLALFNLLLKKTNQKPKDIIATIYNERKPNAYHALRKSLMRHIMDFLVLKQFDDDETSLPAITGIIGLSRYLFENKKDALAWQYLKKAEVLARNYDYFDQLNIIYLLQIEHAQSEATIGLDEILSRYKQNKILLEQNERIALAFGVVKQRLHDSRLTGNVIDFEKVVELTINEFEVHEKFFGKPKLFFQLMSIFRSAVVANKDYFSFEPYLIKNYKQFLKKSGFQPKDNPYKAGLLYMIAHTLYRNKKFKESLEYLGHLNNCIAEAQKTLALEYFSKVIMMTAANNFFLGDGNKAIFMLDQLLTNDKRKLIQEDILNIQLNQCFYYLFTRQPSRANQTLMTIFHSNKWCEKIMGKEWLLKKCLIEVIIQYDLENLDIAQGRMISIEKTFDQFMQQPMYARVRTFIRLIGEITCNPKIATTPGFYNKVEESFSWLPVEQEDLQAVMFYAWLKAKMLNRPSYEVLLELMQQAY